MTINYFQTSRKKPESNRPLYTLQTNISSPQQTAIYLDGVFYLVLGGGLEPVKIQEPMYWAYRGDA